jgi:hypothetical protein
MERPQALPMKFSALQYDILDQLYFTCTFEALVRMFSLSEKELAIQLKFLIQEGIVHQMYFDEVSKDFVMCDIINPEIFAASAFVISKKGLLLHNSR